MNKLIGFDELDSTNSYMKENYKDLSDGTVVFAKKQNKGRGRLNHVWMSEVGNIYLSILKTKDITHKSLFHELVKISLSIVELLSLYGIEAMVKYPNDILVNKKKICGILIESKGSLNLEYIVIGVGLNINQGNFKELKDKATSMSIELKERFVCFDILEKFLNIYENIRFDIDNYNRVSFLNSRYIIYNKVKVKVKEVDVEGFLTLESDKEIIRTNINEISLEDIYDELDD